MLDYEKVGSALGKHTNIELHTFSLNDNPDNNPFVAEIYNNGIAIN